REVPGNVVLQDRRLAGGQRVRDIRESRQTIDVGENGFGRDPEKGNFCSICHSPPVCSEPPDRRRTAGPPTSTLCREIPPETAQGMAACRKSDSRARRKPLR